MTAPARSTSSETRTRTVPRRQRSGRAGQQGGEQVTRARALETPARRERQEPGVRGRSAAAERAYARRAHRRDRWLRVVPESWPGAAAQTSFVLTVMALLVSGLVTTLWLSTAAITDSYRLEKAREQVQLLSDQTEQLRREVAQRESPSALGQLAAELGLVRASDPARLVAKPDGSVEVTGTPKPATGAPTTQATPTGQATPTTQAVPTGEATPTTQAAPTGQAAPTTQAGPTGQQPVPGAG